MRKQRIISIAGICVILLACVLPMVIFRDKLQVTRYSIPAICQLAFHVLYGLAACLFRHKGNYLRFRVIFIRFFFFNFLDPDREYTFTREYKRQFNRMLALYCVVLPQAFFIIAETRGLIGDVKDAKQDRKLRERELKEQKKREEAGRWRWSFPEELLIKRNKIMKNCVSGSTVREILIRRIFLFIRVSAG